MDVDPRDAGQSDPWDGPRLRALRELAERAARAGGGVARERFGGSLHIRRKPDGSDVTDADEAAQAAVLACLHAERPDDAILAEEAIAGAAASTPFAPSHVPALPASPARCAPRPAPSPLCWIIDPLDGTRNYLCGVPIYACSVAAMLDGYPIVGATYEPERNRMYSVSRSEGLLVDGRPFSPSSAAAYLPDGRPRRPLVGIPSSLSGPAYAIVQSWAARVVVRNLGATALHLAMVATGQLRAALITDSKLWDIAAGWLMVTATGGVMTTLAGVPVFPLDLSQYTRGSIPSLAAATPETHARLLPPSPT